MRDKRRFGFVRVLEWVLLAIGVGLLARYGWLSYETQHRESQNRVAVREILTSTAVTAGPSRLPDPVLLPNVAPSTEFIGELTIPRLHLAAAVVIGDEADVLDGAVGYLTDTPLPWQRGNTALAAHRDRLFKPLEQIRRGDDITVSTRHGDFNYRVNATMIVQPSDVWVLDPAPDVDLTLITCYPFVYVGHAPKRFVVRATRVQPE
jgi:sortase A